MWLMNKYEASEDLNEYIFPIWSDYKKIILRTDASNDIENINRQEFVTFSIRWLIQVADTHIKMEKYSEAKAIYREIESICTSEIFDYASHKQLLQVRLSNVDCLIKMQKENGNDEDPEVLSFANFIKLKPNVAHVSPKEEHPIFLDKSDDCLIIEPPKRTRRCVKTTSTLKTVKKDSDKAAKKTVKKLSNDEEASTRRVRITRRMI
jgi:hypothetical protein